MRLFQGDIFDVISSLDAKENLLLLKLYAANSQNKILGSLP